MKQKILNLFGWLMLVVVIVLAGSIRPAHATATAATAVAVTCPATGSSIQVLAAAASRESFLITNTSGATVRVGFLATGTAALTDSNSILLLAGQTFGDASPSIFVGRVMCMSIDGTPDLIYVVETKKP